MASLRFGTSSRPRFALFGARSAALRFGALAAAVALAATLSLSGCPAAHDDYPGSSCKVDNDCFKGEKCMNSICVAAMAPQDLSVVLPPPDLAGADMTELPDLTGDDL
jgi:hypothetical protein